MQFCAFTKLSGVLDSKLSWKYGKFQLVKWGNILAFFSLTCPHLNCQSSLTCISECGWAELVFTFVWAEFKLYCVNKIYFSKQEIFAVNKDSLQDLRVWHNQSKVDTSKIGTGCPDKQETLLIAKYLPFILKRVNFCIPCSVGRWKVRY